MRGSATFVKLRKAMEDHPDEVSKYIEKRILRRLHETTMKSTFLSRYLREQCAISHQGTRAYMAPENKHALLAVPAWITAVVARMRDEELLGKKRGKGKGDGKLRDKEGVKDKDKEAEESADQRPELTSPPLPQQPGGLEN